HPIRRSHSVGVRRRTVDPCCIAMLPAPVLLPFPSAGLIGPLIGSCVEWNASGDEVPSGGHGGVDVESSGASASLESADRRSAGSLRSRAAARLRIPA